ncbi:nitrous oxide reductase family maturation protein NosD [Limihaloglobus sulfuriphilus]|uniref:Nitrous oxide reductase family maturation protein NosD n=1 Tax=Limihaloglobus sulfuriphilus TaxID=1851148 RepID=A0A1Q2MFD2_9BACT|nr:right-handed parallel beta-helix repeat-containing protein [Limihaloglobus sulfuriphilus]AQQ71369.1 nitrous oxide reductase family maturation protein NosD [Limihaloglobus sulfuriphilus]
MFRLYPISGVSLRAVIAFMLLAVSAASLGICDEQPWQRVNGGYALNSGSPARGSAVFLKTVVTGSGDLVYIYNDQKIPAAMGRFQCCGSQPSYQWQVYSGGKWSADSDAVPQSLSNTIAAFSDPVNIFAVEGSEDAFFAAACFPSGGIRNSLIGMDIHGGVVNLEYDGTAGSRFWVSGAEYQRFGMSALVDAWNGVKGDMAFDPHSGTGILISTKGDWLNGGYGDKLVAVNYDRNNSKQRWRRWDSQNGGWYKDNSWPPTRDVARYALPNPKAAKGEKYTNPRIARIDNGRYIVTFGYAGTKGSITSMLLYDENAGGEWSWFNGSGFSQGGSFDYAPIVDSDVSRTVRLEVLQGGGIKFFYQKNNHVYEKGLKFKETGLQITETENQLAAASEYITVQDKQGGLWLFYVHKNNELMLIKKPSAGGWTQERLVYTGGGLKIRILDVNFAGKDQMPIAFTAEQDKDGSSEIYAVSPDCKCFRQDEKPLRFKSQPKGITADARIKYAGETVNTAKPYAPYGSQHPARMVIDSNQYLYSVNSAVCNAVIRDKDETSPERAVSWGGFWDHLYFPGGCCVDNIRGKVYMSNRIIDGGGGSAWANSYIREFDMDYRTKSLGWKKLRSKVPPGWDSKYRSTIFGSGKWISDIALDQSRGRLYAVSAGECRIKVYDVNGSKPVLSKTFGGPGSAAGEFRFPQGIDIDPDGNLYVVDIANHRIQKFAAGGKFIKSWGSPGRDSGEFVYPYDIAADPKLELVYVADPFNSRLQIFDRQGRFIYSFSSWQQQGKPAQFGTLSGVAADGQGNIYAGNDRNVLKFTIVGFDRDDDKNGIPDLLEGGVHAIRVQSVGGAVIEPAADITLKKGQDAGFRISFPAGQSGDVIVDGESVGAVTEYEFKGISQNHSITALAGRIYNRTSAAVYETIRDAVSHASAGDVIVLSPGTYNEQINFAGKEIRITGIDPLEPEIVAKTVIDAQGAQAAAIFTQGEGSGAVLEGVTLTNASSGLLVMSFSMQAKQARPIIRNCKITGNTVGVFVMGGTPTVEKCWIGDNKQNQLVLANSSAVIRNNTIASPQIDDADSKAIVIQNSPDAVLEDNRLDASGGDL